MLADCHNANRENCLIYEKENAGCIALVKGRGTETCSFYKDTRNMTFTEIAEYRTGVQMGFRREDLW